MFIFVLVYVYFYLKKLIVFIKEKILIFLFNILQHTYVCMYIYWFLNFINIFFISQRNRANFLDYLIYFANSI